MRRNKERSFGQIVTRLLFLIYCGVMLWLLFGQRFETGAVEGNWNLIPFQTLKLYVRILQSSTNSYLLRHAFINLVGNVVMFIPLGYFLPTIWIRLRPLLACLLCVLPVIIAIEAVQFLTGLGSCDIDDLILNLPGALIGWAVCRLCTGKRL